MGSLQKKISSANTALGSLIGNERKHKIIKLEMNEKENTNARKNPEIHRTCCPTVLVILKKYVMYDFQKKT